MPNKLTTLAEKADRLYQIRNERIALQRQVDAMAAEETQIKDDLIASIEASGATGVAGQTCRATVVKKQVPSVTDWDALWPFIVKHKAFDLVQRRLSDPAVRERWSDGVEIPGVASISATTLSINKV